VPNPFQFSANVSRYMSDVEGLPFSNNRPEEAEMNEPSDSRGEVIASQQAEHAALLRQSRLPPRFFIPNSPYFATSSAQILHICRVCFPTKTCQIQEQEIHI
jgi:hypothetical protein